MNKKQSNEDRRIISSLLSPTKEEKHNSKLFFFVNMYHAKEKKAIFADEIREVIREDEEN